MTVVVIDAIGTMFGVGDRAPPIVLSTDNHADLSHIARACGARGGIVKPFIRDQLVAIVKRLTLAAA